MTSRRDRTGPSMRRGSGGMTLLEIMLALGILTIAMTGLIASLMGSFSSTSFNKAQTVALQDAQGVLEALTYIRQEGAAGTPDTLLDVAANINAGMAAPGGNIQMPIGANASLPGQQFRVNVYAPPQYVQPAWGAPVLPAVLPTANWDEYEIVVTVQWQQGQRVVQSTVRTVHNILSAP